MFALSNGHIGLRGNLDEGEPTGAPGTYLNSFYEVRPLPYAELSYGNPEDGQVMINVTNGKVFRLLIDDEPFDVRYGRLERHERTLDLRDGVLRREVEWISPAGQRVRGALDAARLVRPAVDRGDPVRGRAGRELGADRRSVRARRQRARARRDRGPAGGRGAARAARARTALIQRHEGQSHPPDEDERTAHGRRDGPHRRRPGGNRDGGRERTRPRAVDREHRAQAGRDAADRQVPLLRVVEPAIAAGAA